MPPPTRIVSPVMCRARALTRNSAASATSCASPRRRSGVCILVSILTLSGRFEIMSVCVIPGAMTFTRIPLGPYSTASVRAKETSAAFVTTYGDCWTGGTPSANTEPTKSSDPFARSVMPGSAALAQLNAPLSCVSICAWNASHVSASNGAGTGSGAAQWVTSSTGPKRRSASAKIALPAAARDQDDPRRVRLCDGGLLCFHVEDFDLRFALDQFLAVLVGYDRPQRERAGGHRLLVDGRDDRQRVAHERRREKIERLRRPQRAASGQNRADHRRDERRAEHAVHDRAPEQRPARKRRVDVQRVEVAGQRGERVDVVLREPVREVRPRADRDPIEGQD